MQRIWNESELKSMPEWTKYSLDTWFKKGEDTPLDTLILGQEITAEFIKEWIVLDYMIAKEPKDEIRIELVDIPPRELTLKGINLNQNNMETKKVPLSNGTVLEVGGTITSKHWDKGEYVTITAIGKEFFLASHQNSNKDETSYLMDADYWLPYTPPTPQKEWKTFLIETVSQKTKVPYRFFSQYESEENARLHHKTATSITEVKINIEEVK